MPFPKLSRKIVREAVANAGIRPGEFLYVASHAPILGPTPGIIDDTIDILIEAIGPSGTLIMPTFNWSYCSGEVFDPAQTPSKVGVITEAFRKRPGVIRTCYPPWCSFGVLGPRTADIVAIQAKSPFGHDSVCQYLADHNALYLLIGTTYNDAVIHLHWLEELLEVPYRFWKPIRGNIRLNGRLIPVESKMFARNLELNPAVDISPFMKAFDDGPQVKRVNLGLGVLRAFRTKDFNEYLRPILERDKLAFLTPESKTAFLRQQK